MQRSATFLDIWHLGSWNLIGIWLLELGIFRQHACGFRRDGLEIEQSQIVVGRSANVDPRIRRRPDGGGGWTEQKQTWRASGRSEMRDAAVVSEKELAAREDGREFRQREMTRHENRRVF